MVLYVTNNNVPINKSGTIGYNFILKPASFLSDLLRKIKIAPAALANETLSINKT